MMTFLAKQNFGGGPSLGNANATAAFMFQFQTSDTVLDKVDCNFLVWEVRNTNLYNINPHRTPTT